MNAQEMEEAEHGQGPRHWVSHLSGYCCLAAFSGGDCGCDGDPDGPQEEEPADG